MARYLLGLDAGSGSGRALLFDLESGAFTSARRPWGHEPVPGTFGMAVDLDLESMWELLVDATREVLERNGASSGQVLGVAAASMRFALVLLDASGDVIHAGSNRDGRATGPAVALGNQRGEELHARTGHWPVPVQPSARLRWIAAEQPELWGRVAHALSVSDWLAWRLCGELASDPSQASVTGLFGLAMDGWDLELADELDIPRRMLPEIRPSGTRLGGLSGPAARSLGLAEGTPVAMGGGDTQCALLGMGVVEAGCAAVVGGTTTPIQVVTERPATGPRVWTERHLLKNRWVVESSAGGLGQGIAWTASLLFGDAAQPVTRLLAEAARSRPGAAGMLAALGPAAMDARALEMPVGSWTFSPMVECDGAELRSHLARAVIEGGAYSVRANLEQARATANGSALRAGSVHAGGGLSFSGIWLQTLADVLGEPVRAGTHFESSAVGAALCAGVAAGVWSGLEQAARSLDGGDPCSPQPQHVEDYERLYPAWRRYCDARGSADAVATAGLLPEALRSRSAKAGAAGVPPHPRILITADMDDAALEAFGALGEVEYASFREAMRLLTGPSLVKALAGVEVFVTEVDVVDAAALEKLPDLRVVASCRTDAVNVDVEACTAYGIPVLNAPGRNAQAVADLSVAFVLMHLRKLPRATAFLRQPGIQPGDMGRMGQAFRAFRGRELGGKTIGLIGLGAVGRAVARRLHGFGARVLAFDPYLGSEEVALCDAESVPLDTLLETSDVVSLHAPATDSTRGLLGEAELARMKPGAFLVNTARAALVDEDALQQALASGHLGGAALDVFAVEPPGSDHPLLALDSLIATPHVGGNTDEVAGHQGRIVAEDLGRLVRGEAPRHVVDPRALEGFDWSAPRPPPDAQRLAALRDRPGPAVSDLQRDARSAAPTAAATTPEAAAEAPQETVQAMERILRRFVDACVGDEALGAFASDKDVTLHFVLADLGLAFWLRLRNGLAADLGAPAEEAEVQLRLPADLLDGMFTGRSNAMQAAMEGRLSFTGDAGKAMTLQEIQSDLSRLYRAAREEMGDPGDLAELAAPSTPAGTPASAAGAGDEAVRAEILGAVSELYAQELITATGGNVSARVPGTDELLITPSGMFKGDLRPELLVRLDLQGHVLDPDAPSPSSERLMHCAVYSARPEANAVVHAHAPHATILANTGLPFLPISTEAAFFGDIPRIPFIMPGTKDLADAIEEAARESWAVLMVNHGLLVAGRSLRRAADMVEIIDRSAEIILGCYAVGKEPPTLPEDVVKSLRKMGDLVA